MNRPSTVHHPVPYPAPRPLGGTGGARSAVTAPRTVASQAPRHRPRHAVPGEWGHQRGRDTVRGVGHDVKTRPSPTPVLVTGATGYIGAHLVNRLEHEGRQVRCLARRPSRLAGRVASTTEIVAGDLLAPESLGPAIRGVSVAYYLVHSMDTGGDFAELDRQAATNFARSARAAGLPHIVYLSGLGSGPRLSAHLASRHEVGRILRSSGAVTTELRASIVIGAGSASFETVRAVVEQLPAIPAPTGLQTAAQPIAIEDLLDYLVAAADLTTPQRDLRNRRRGPGQLRRRDARVRPPAQAASARPAAARTHAWRRASTAEDADPRARTCRRSHGGQPAARHRRQ